MGSNEASSSYRGRRVNPLGPGRGRANNLNGRVLRRPAGHGGHGPPLDVTTHRQARLLGTAGRHAASTGSWEGVGQPWRCRAEPRREAEAGGTHVTRTTHKDQACDVMGLPRHGLDSQAKTYTTQHRT